MRLQAQMEAIKTVQDKFAEIRAKLLLSYRQLYYPTFQSLSDLLKQFEIPETCNQDCLFDNYYKPMRRGEYY